MTELLTQLYFYKPVPRSLRDQFCFANQLLQQTNSEKLNPNATQLDRIEDAVALSCWLYILTYI